MSTVAPPLIREWTPIVPRRRRTDDEDPGVLARILYRLRVDSGMSQIQVAERAGWHRSNSYYSDLERGDIKLPGKDKIADLERAFGVEPGHIENQLPRRERIMLGDPALPPSIVAVPVGDEELALTVDAVLLLRGDDANLRRVRRLIRETILDAPDPVATSKDVLADS